MLWIKDEISASWEQRVETSQWSDLNRSSEMQGEGGPTSWDRGLTLRAQSRPSNLPSSDRTAGAFRREFPFKNRCFPLPFSTLY